MNSWYGRFRGVPRIGAEPPGPGPLGPPPPDARPMIQAFEATPFGAAPYAASQMRAVDAYALLSNPIFWWPSGKPSMTAQDQPTPAWVPTTIAAGTPVRVLAQGPSGQCLIENVYQQPPIPVASNGPMVPYMFSPSFKVWIACSLLRPPRTFQPRLNQQTRLFLWRRAAGLTA
jgi:hypothetical protein